MTPHQLELKLIEEELKVAQGEAEPAPRFKAWTMKEVAEAIAAVREWGAGSRYDAVRLV